MITQIYDVNMVPLGQHFQRGVTVPIVTVSQFDDSSRQLIFNLFNLGNHYVIPENAVAALLGKKPDGRSFAYQMTVSGESQVSILLPLQASTKAGTFPAEIILFDRYGDRLGSANFRFLVESNAADEQAIASAEDIPIFTHYVAQAAAQASAASESATAAAGSASAAYDSEVAAAGSAQVASQSEELARGYASSAQDSKESAEANAILSESWAVGGTGTRQFENYDNSKFYSEVAQQAAAESGWIQFYIDEWGYLHYVKTINSDLDFYIENGDLYVVI